MSGAPAAGILPEGLPSAPSEEAHLARRGMRVRVVRDVFEIIAFALAGVWALWTFWYQASYAPKHETPAVDWKLGLEIVGRKSTGELAVRATVKAKNTGKATERLAGLVVNVTGVVLAPDTTADPFARITPNAESWHEQVGGKEVASVLLASEGDRFGDGRELSILPDEDWLWETTFVIPPRDYALLEGRLTEMTIMGSAPIRTAWFTEQRDADGPLLAATDACRASKECRVLSARDSTAITLWPSASASAAGVDASAAPAPAAAAAAPASAASALAFPSISPP